MTASPTPCFKTQLDRFRSGKRTGETRVGGGLVSVNPEHSWQAIGAGDFNGDGFSDILF